MFVICVYLFIQHSLNKCIRVRRFYQVFFWKQFFSGQMSPPGISSPDRRHQRHQMSSAPQIILHFVSPHLPASSTIPFHLLFVPCSLPSSLFIDFVVRFCEQRLLFLLLSVLWPLQYIPCCALLNDDAPNF